MSVDEMAQVDSLKCRVYVEGRDLIICGISSNCPLNLDLLGTKIGPNKSN